MLNGQMGMQKTVKNLPRDFWVMLYGFGSSENDWSFGSRGYDAAGALVRILIRSGAVSEISDMGRAQTTRELRAQ